MQVLGYDIVEYTLVATTHVENMIQIGWSLTYQDTLSPVTVHHF
jgi:hypothetical protein